MVNRIIKSTLALPVALAALLLCGCSNESGTNQAGNGQTPSAATKTAHEAESQGGAAGHGGAIIELGTTTIGSFTVRASRDEGEINAGGDAPIDVWLAGGDISKVTAVRFWIGIQSGDGSIKAKADIENPAEPNRWHTHAAVPSPLPAGSKLWVEIEVDGQKHSGSFDLMS